MINSSHSWMSEAQSWLAAPCAYATAKCLRSRAHALQVGARRPFLPLLDGGVAHFLALISRD